MFSISVNPRMAVKYDVEIRIPHALRRTILAELARMGISWGMLHPDLDGIAKSLVEEAYSWPLDRGVDPSAAHPRAKG
jgi:hypothetical protein